MLNVFKFVSRLGALASAIVLSHCGGNYSETIEVVRTSGFQQSHGPFDSSGNYVERWADKPPRRIFVNKKSKKSKKQETKQPEPLPPLPPRITPPIQQLPSIQQPRAIPPTHPTPVPRPTAQVIKPLTKAPLRHRVSSTDTLYGLSRRYGVSVTSIQRANRLKGTTIITGSTLLIPR